MTEQTWRILDTWGRINDSELATPLRARKPHRYLLRQRHGMGDLFDDARQADRFEAGETGGAKICAFARRHRKCREHPALRQSQHRVPLPPPAPGGATATVSDDCAPETLAALAEMAAVAAEHFRKDG